MNAHKQKGRCACGSVHFTALTQKTYGVCHCKTCRKWVGGPWMGVRSGDTAKIEGEVTVWKSTSWGERGSCANCGAAIFYRMPKSNEVILALGLFEDQNGWTMKSEIFVDQKPDHYAFGNKTIALTRWGTIIRAIMGRLP